MTMPKIIFALLFLGLAWTDGVCPVLAAEDEADGEARIEFADCPPEVQKTIQRESLGARLDGVFKETDDGELFFTAEVSFGQLHYEIVVAADGTLLEKVLEDDEQGDSDEIEFSDCPTAVQKTLRREAMDAAIEEIEKRESGEQEIYVAEVVLDGKGYRIKVAEDGTLISKALDDEDDDEKEEETELIIVEERRNENKVSLKLSGKSFEIKVVDDGILISFAPDDDDDCDDDDECKDDD